MRNPLTELVKLGQAPGGISRDLGGIAEALRSVPVIEDLLANLNSVLGPLITDVESIRQTVEPQQKRVAHIEAMMEQLSERTITIEHAVLALQAKVDAATKLLPDPADDRGTLSKAKDVLTGG